MSNMTQIELFLNILGGIWVSLVIWWSFWWLLWKITGRPKGFYTNKKEN